MKAEIQKHDNVLVGSFEACAKHEDNSSDMQNLSREKIQSIVSFLGERSTNAYIGAVKKEFKELRLKKGGRADYVANSLRIHLRSVAGKGDYKRRKAADTAEGKAKKSAAKNTK